ncbi:ABC transporter permease/substrate-binding protein [Sebaldella sp. S0638]|uniref:ABC transporter permease/substrate-binding protein n=1 Tax=Sebaldella sp. S0638 TaxID=2957809 RepID=UPI0020A0F565|nr:ABC transporter permease/substrate-binding protein [Sebaldella sp. S0638]MCP1223632.1 ABC transporter permease/substrate-binding protein [Sebaldella sp. S0638]
MNYISILLKDFMDKKQYYMELIVQHIQISVTAIVLSTVFGIMLGILIYYNKKLRLVILPVVNSIYTIPSIATFGLLISFVGIGFFNAVTTLVIYGLLPIVTATYTGLENVNKKTLEVSKAMGATERQTFLKVQIPLAMPVLVSGFKTMVTMTISLAGIASFIGAGGLGESIYRGINTNNSNLIVIGSILIIMLNITFDFLISRWESYTIKKINGKAGKKKKQFYFTWLIFIFIFAAAFSGSIKKHEKIVVASKPWTEQIILGEMAGILIEENTDIKVERKFNIAGGTRNIHLAMLNKEVDLYPEYTGTAWLTVLKRKMIKNQDELYKILNEEYQKNYNFKWLGLLGFNNSFELTLKRELAEKENIKTYSDLAKKSGNYKFAAEFEFFEREDGFDAMSDLYGMNFRKTVGMDVNLKYKAVSNGNVDVINSFTTDSLIKKHDLVILKDDRNYFPQYNAGFIIREDTVRKYPKAAELLEKLNNSISDEQMRDLNYEVDVNKKSPYEVAKTFLKERNLIK